jgi:uncharacterized protein YqeY
MNSIDDSPDNIIKNLNEQIQIYKDIVDLKNKEISVLNEYIDKLLKHVEVSMKQTDGSIKVAERIILYYKSGLVDETFIEKVSSILKDIRSSFNES